MRSPSFHSSLSLAPLLLAGGAALAPSAMGSQPARGAGTGGPVESVGLLVGRFLDGDVSSSGILDLSSRFGGHIVESLFEEAEEREATGRLSPRQRTRFDDAMKGVPTAVLSESSPGDSWRTAALLVVGRLGERDDLEGVFSLSESTEEDAASSDVLDALETALIGIFERHPQEVGRVRPRIPSLDSAQRVRLIRALGEHGQGRLCGSDRVLNLLGELLSGEEVYRSMILAQMGRQPAPRLHTGALGRVRGLLSSKSPLIQREAVLTAGKLEDLEAFDMLVDLLEHPDERVRSNAHWSLKNISGRTFRADVRQWRAWYDAEHGWWTERAPELIEGLHSQKAGEVVPALNELAMHRLYRHSISEELRGLIRSPKNDIALLSCAAAFTLGSPRPVPELVDALEHPDERIRSSALRALEGITNAGLGPEAGPWRRALEL